MKSLFSIMCAFILFMGTALAEQKLFTTEQTKAHKLDEIESILHRHLKITDTNKNPKNILFFVHGRGKHPAKGLEIIPKLEKDYNIKVIMFHWPSWKNWYSRPVENAKNASKDLYYVLNKMNEFKNKYPHLFLKTKMTMMCHSMGNIVFRNFMEKYYKGTFTKGLFDQLIINSADVPAKNHHKWVNRINFSANNVITYNRDDAILAGSKFLDLTKFTINGPRLGSTIKRRFGIRYYPLSSNAKYFNLNRLSKFGHRHYNVTKYEPSKLMENLYKRMLNGMVIAPTKANGVYKIKKDRVYFFKE